MTTHERIILDGESLTIEQVAAVTHGTQGQPEITISGKAMEKVARTAEAIEQLLKRNEIAYGITTGFGAFKDRIRTCWCNLLQYLLDVLIVAVDYMIRAKLAGNLQPVRLNIDGDHDASAVTAGGDHTQANEP